MKNIVKKKQKIKVKFYNVKPTEQEAREIKREIEKVYNDIFDEVWKEMKAKKEAHNKQ